MTVILLTLLRPEGILPPALRVSLRLTQDSTVAHLGLSPVLIFAVALP